MVSGVNMAVNLGGIAMRNPLNTASGTFGNGVQFEGFYDVGATLGAITCKGVAAEPWVGNPAPRLTELPSAMMNNFRNILSVIGAEPKIVANLYDWSLVKFLVQRGYVGAYVSTDISSKWQGVKSIPILGLEMTSTHKVMWSRELGKDSEAQNIIKFLVERLKKQ